MVVAASCPDCGAALATPWCGQCGERAPAPDELSARRFVAVAWDEVTDLDSRTWRTLRAFLTPGELSRATFATERRRYLPPLRLYLIVSGLYFLLAWDVYRAAIASAMAQAAATMPDQDLSRTLSLFHDPAVFGRIADLTALFRFAAVVLFGFGVAVVFLRQRRPLGAHLIFATHYYCADFLLFGLLAIPIAFLGPELAIVGFSRAMMLGSFALLLYLILALRRAYALRWPGAIVRGVALMALDLVLSTLANQIAVITVMATR